MLAALDVEGVEVCPGLFGLVSDMGEVASIGCLASTSIRKGMVFEIWGGRTSPPLLLIRFGRGCCHFYG